jgi:alpha-tubulin suppressor-like RCC1 family protein
MAIDEGGYLWSWGYNGDGVSSDGSNNWLVGDGTKISQLRPVRIKSNTKFKEIYSGLSHNLVIDESGGLWAWGNNDRGQLGDGTTEDKPIPVQIMANIKFAYASIRYKSSFAIDESGNLWAWGLNSGGQLGDGTKTDRYSPVQILSGLKFQINISEYGIYLTGGRILDSTYAIDESGKLWAWGSNYRILGDGTSIDRLLPVNIKPETKFKAIPAGNGHSLAIDANDFLWAWGSNSYGQIGVGNTNSVSTPVQILIGKKIVSAKAGHDYSMAIDDNGKLWLWGLNESGQLGDGDSWYQNPIWLNNLHFSDGIPSLPAQSDIKILSDKNFITVESTGFDVYNVYNLLGNRVATGTLHEGLTKIPCKSGFYIFTSGKFRCKIYVN